MSKKVEIVKAKREGDLVSYQTIDIDSYFSLGGKGMSDGAIRGEKALTHSFLMDTLRKVMGRTLTILDASILDKTQNKAVKDLVRGIFSDEMDFAANMAFNQEELQKMVPEDVEGIESIEIEEALGVN